MWTTEVTIDQLREKGRWKVEFFCNTQLETSTSVYELVPLKDLVKERRASLKPQDYSEQFFNYIGLENVASLTGDLVDFQPKLGKEIKSASKIFQQGDILYGRLRPYLNKAYLADEPISSGICSGEFFVLTPNTSKVIPRFLRTLLSSDYIQQYVRNMQTGSALPRLDLDDLLEMQVPLPPIQVQARYESFLVAEEASRRELAYRAQLMPVAIMTSVMQALEHGTDDITLLLSPQPHIINDNSLPQGMFEQKRRNRKKALSSH